MKLWVGLPRISPATQALAAPAVDPADPELAAAIAASLQDQPALGPEEMRRKRLARFG